MERKPHWRRQRLPRSVSGLSTCWSARSTKTSCLTCTRYGRIADHRSSVATCPCLFSDGRTFWPSKLSPLSPPCHFSPWQRLWPLLSCFLLYSTAALGLPLHTAPHRLDTTAMLTFSAGLSPLTSLLFLFLLFFPPPFTVAPNTT